MAQALLNAVTSVMLSYLERRSCRKRSNAGARTSHSHKWLLLIANLALRRPQRRPAPTLGFIREGQPTRENGAALAPEAPYNSTMSPTNAASPRTPVVGLTGGIASGKSTVARMLEAYGIPIVDADQLARQVTEPESAGLKAVADAFGTAVLRPDGSLNRQRLADIVFSDATQRLQLQAILHPLIQTAAQARFRALDGDGAPYLVYEAALLIESGRHKALPATVLVWTREDLQRRRLAQRDGWHEATIRQRIAAQLPSDERLPHANFIIDNNGTLESTQRQVDVVHQQLVARFVGRPVSESP